jgi:predicted dehydrogenase
MTTRFGVVGAGAMGEIYANALAREVPGARLVAVAGGSRSAGLAARLGVAHDTVDSLLARPDIDAVALTSPTPLHRQQTVAAARAGKHVFTEKPMAATLDACDDMLEACERAGVLLAVNSVTRYRHGIWQAKQLVDEGAIGAIRMVRHTYCFILTDYVNGKDWVLEPDAGSPFLDQGAHCNDVIRWFLGSDATHAMATYASYGSAPPPEQSAMVTYCFESGAMAQLWCSYEFPRPGLGPRGWTIEYMFVGSEGIIDVEYYGTLRLGRGDRWQTLYEHPTVDILANPLDPNRTYPYRDQLMDFVHAIDEHRPPLVTGLDGRAGIAMAVAADLAARERRVVDLRELTPR